MTEMHTHWSDASGGGVLWNFYAFLLRFAWVEIFPALYNFPDVHPILVITPITDALHVDTPPT